MSETAAETPKKKGGPVKLIVMLLGALVLGGAGAAGGLYAAGAFSHEEAVAEEDPAMPRLVKKGEDPEAIAAQFAAEASHGEEGATKKHKAIDLPRPKNVADYQATYFQMPVPFTSNVIDTDSFVQVSIAVSTYYDNRVVEALKTHEMAIRSAVLMLLSQEAAATLATPEGKNALQGKLTKLLNQVLKEKTGYGGVDNVYFTNFVIQ